MAHKNKSNYSAYKERQNKRASTAPTSATPISTAPAGAAKPLLGKHKKPQEIYSLEEANDRLYDVFKNHDFNLVTHEQRRQLAHFYRLLMQNQKDENFTRLLTLKDIAIKHFIDSLVFLDFYQPQFPLLDMGTGPGFPGLPLKIKFPKEKILLGEGVQKRVNFLKKVREDMHLENLEIIGRNIDAEFVYPVKSVITRAVEDIGNTMQNTINCLVDGGHLIFMKGPNVDPELKLAEAHKEFYSLEHDFKYTIPKTPHERRLIVYKKIKSPPLDPIDPIDPMED
ncbi:MAG: 16S rRNA (guanine(527)-N(7))-methyltransferase RsmG [Bdellovibrionaceae bacterium]|nr:16S rRNA (guanine(527)-N(7))-methyltransferase RsmG [Pseudobdellovibrionaceae bacterium]